MQTGLLVSVCNQAPVLLTITNTHTCHDFASVPSFASCQIAAAKPYSQPHRLPSLDIDAHDRPASCTVPCFPCPTSLSLLSYLYLSLCLYRLIPFLPSCHGEGGQHLAVAVGDWQYLCPACCCPEHGRHAARPREHHAWASGGGGLASGLDRAGNPCHCRAGVCVRGGTGELCVVWCLGLGVC